MKTLHDKITEHRLLFTEIVDEIEKLLIEVDNGMKVKKPDYLIRELNQNYDAGKMLCECDAIELFSKITELLKTYPKIIIITLLTEINEEPKNEDKYKGFNPWVDTIVKPNQCKYCGK